METAGELVVVGLRVRPSHARARASRGNGGRLGAALGLSGAELRI